MLFLLHQILSVYADSSLVRVTRAKEEQDSFRLPGSFESCSRQNECNRFNANLSPAASKRDHCSCSCSRQKAATFGVKNGYWQCIDNKEIRQRELSGKLVSVPNMLIYFPPVTDASFSNNEKYPMLKSVRLKETNENKITINHVHFS